MSDSILDLVSDLRRLRLERGALTYEAIARSAGLSRSIVAEAFGGARLPSERTLFGVVTALGADPSSWLVRRAELAGSVTPIAATTAAQPGESDAGESTPASAELHSYALPAPVEAAPHESGGEPAGDSSEGVIPGAQPLALAEHPAPPGAYPLRPPPRRMPVLAMVAMVTAAAVGGALLSRAFWPREVEVVAGEAPVVSDVATAVPVDSEGDTVTGQIHLEGAKLPVTDGANIWDTKCVDDAIDVASSDREFDVHMGIRVSFACETVWAVAYRNDGDTYGNDIRLRLYPKTDQDPGQPQEILAEDSPYAVTTMIVQESLANDRFCAEAWIINDGVEVSLGDPICA